MLAMQSMIALQSLIAQTRVPDEPEKIAALPLFPHNSESKEVPVSARSARSPNSFIPFHIYPP